MLSLKLTDQQKDKLLEMCKVLFPDGNSGKEIKNLKIIKMF